MTVIGHMLSEERVGVGAWLGAWWDCDGGSSPEHGGEDAANPHCVGRNTKEMPGPSPLTQSRMHYFIFPQRQLSYSACFALKLLVVTTPCAAC